MGVVVVGYGLADVAFQPVYSKVHLGQADGGGVLLQGHKGEPLSGIPVLAFHDPGALHEHAARTAGRVQHRALVRFDHIGDQGDQGYGGEELAVVVGLEVGKTGQEVFINATEDISRGAFEFVGIERPQQLAQHLVVQFLVLRLGQQALQSLVIGLDGFHGRHDGLDAVTAVFQGHQMIELGLGAQKNGPLAGKILLGRRPLFAAPRGQTGRRMPSLTAR